MTTDYYEKIFIEEIDELINHHRHKQEMEDYGGGSNSYHSNIADTLQNIRNRFLTGSWSTPYQNIINKERMKREPDYLELERLAAKYGKILK